MGREQRRKELKKNKNKLKNKEELEVHIHLSTLVKIIIAIAAILLVLYYILAVFVTKEIDISSDKGTSSNDSKTSESINNKILASSTFSQIEEDYYVYFYDFNDEDKTLANVIGNSDKKIYRVDTSSSLNSNYVSDTSNRNATNLNDLKVKNPTLLHITNDTISNYYEGVEEIEGFFTKQ